MIKKFLIFCGLIVFLMFSASQHVEAVYGKIYCADNTNPGFINRMHLDGSNPETLVNSAQNPYGIAFDLTNSKMYWTTGDSIRRANLEGSSPEILITGIPAIAIALDYVHEKIYWTEIQSDIIQRSNLDGSNVETPVTNLGDIDSYGIAVDPINEKMYWTSTHTRRLYKSNLDGSNIELLNTGVCTTGIALAIIDELNVNPIVGTITALIEPSQVNTIVNTSANFTDPNILDSHTAIWEWGDNSTSSGIVTETNGSGSVSGSHVYNSAGVYTVNVTVFDDIGGYGQPTNTFQYIVVYDPSAGFITGSGSYVSQAGWYISNPQTTGKVRFGINAKYTTGSTPIGQTKFSFKNGNLDFDSTSYQWLVVSGTKSILKGNGTINGSGNFTFLVSAIDGSQSGGQYLIRFQIKDSSFNDVVYDSQFLATETTDPTTLLTSGIIKNRPN